MLSIIDIIKVSQDQIETPQFNIQYLDINFLENILGDKAKNSNHYNLLKHWQYGM